MGHAKKPKHRWYRFWIKSSRGTDSETFKQLPHRLSKVIVREHLERWCSGFGAWVVSENHVSYGFEKVRQPPVGWRRRRGLTGPPHKTAKLRQRLLDLYYGGGPGVQAMILECLLHYITPSELTLELPVLKRGKGVPGEVGCKRNV